jgi:4-hydroxy-2-oxoheptanedioate aldolase
MDKFKSGMLDILKELKDDYGTIAIKAEFEAEGSRKDELIMLRDLIETTGGLKFIIKIGGCEAVHDLDQCKLLSATGVMAPMIETPFALEKFKKAFTKVFGSQSGVERIINAETKNCLSCFDEILKQGEDFLTGVTVGRSDLSASMGIARKDIESQPVFEATKEFTAKAKAKNLVTNFGGNIGTESVPFIVKMYPYIDRFETRKVVISKSDDAEFLRKAIICALNFELLYLQFKSDYYTRMAQEDIERVKRLQNQVNSVG